MALVPVTDDPDTGGFFRAAAAGRLAVCRCATCDTVLHAPTGYCRNCGGYGQRWADVAPTGRVYSYTVVTHQVHPDYPTPHTLLLVELDDVPEVRLVGRLDGRPPVHVGQPLVADFVASAADQPVLPVWRLA
jgi:uncharacterized OB-fold protein